MKSTGMVRKMDELGRVVIPIEIRRTMNLNVKDPLEIFTDEDTIVLKKFSSDLVCDITGEFSVDNKKFAGGKLTLSKEGAAELMAEIKRRFGDTL
ncbi:AbrB/MazE/SpoVT family DNA-binding domain-containing protein [Listeria monocytogenes]|nr:AbrB/MazE/SpoVT family DNA-binding domain-containing protein [Listeria monocytogenes]EED2403342.1 AbrB/MazE/SpoVT family DNA-binding domain-containing protein [Listeria monocytogenes]